MGTGNSLIVVCNYFHETRFLRQVPSESMGISHSICQSCLERVRQGESPSYSTGIIDLNQTNRPELLEFMDQIKDLQTFTIEGWYDSPPHLDDPDAAPCPNSKPVV